jgi:hypothetical protein
MQIIVRTSQVPPPLTQHISQIIVDSLSPIVTNCVLNLFHNHLLLNDVLHFFISMMNLKLKEEIKMSPFFENLIEDDLGACCWMKTWLGGSFLTF